MNYKLKAFRLFKRLDRFKNRNLSRKQSKSDCQQQPVSPRLNQLYKIDFNHAGEIKRNVIARYTGLSKSNKFMMFQPIDFFTKSGSMINLICLDKLPAKIIQLKQDLFSIHSPQRA